MCQVEGEVTAHTNDNLRWSCLPQLTEKEIEQVQ